MTEIVIDLSLSNDKLYCGCEVETVAGRKNLTTPVAEAVERLGENIARILAEVPPEARTTVVLTGAMAIWAYLVVFHHVVHQFSKVYYDDGRGNRLLVAAHG